MNRRAFLATIGASSAALISGCSSTNAPHGDQQDEKVTINYDYDKEYFSINSLYVSRNAPDKVGVTVRVVSQQFAGTTIPLELWVVDKNGNTVFHEPEFAVGIDGGAAAIGTAWFTATEEEFYMDLYSKARFRKHPPDK